jgi:hypothetical protein
MAKATSHNSQSRSGRTTKLLAALGLCALATTSATEALAVTHVDRVYAGRTDVYRRTFSAYEPAYVLVSGDGDTNLDCRVYDENGNLVDSDTDGTDDCVLTWMPRWTGRFRLEVKNLGRISNQYVMLTSE